MNRHGTILMIFLLLMVSLAILAVQMIPNEEMINRRIDETILSSEVSQVREAYDLMRMASPTWVPFEADFDPDHADAPASIAKILDQLFSSGFLRSKDVYSPGFRRHLWGTEPGKFYWHATGNIASNSSFQVMVGDGLAWDWSRTDTVAATDSFFPQDQAVDDYPFQNKLGDQLFKNGSSLKIMR